MTRAARARERSGRRARRATTAAVWLLVTAFPAGMVGAEPPIAAADSKQGYWWYRVPPPPEPVDTTAPDDPVRPRIPPMAELARWTPTKIRELIIAQRDYAATVLTVDAVADFWRLEDFARRKARAFAGITQIALLRHPELNSRSASPLVGDARAERGARQEGLRRTYLRGQARDFALIMLGRSGCGYCRVQWPIVQRFRDDYGWQVSQVDIDRRPDIALRLGVEITPTTVIIRRGSHQHMVIASGVEAYPNLAQMAYQAVRLLTGAIRPEQFLTGPGEEDGFFDALAGGPVGASDPATLISSPPASGEERP